jgi:hypothetical protein
MKFKEFDSATSKIILGILNGDARAYAHLALRYGREFFSGYKAKFLEDHPKAKFVPLPHTSVIESLRGRSPFIEFPKLVRRSQDQKWLISAIEAMRRLPIGQLQLAFSDRLWRCRACGKFFVANHGHSRSYCGRKCSGNFSARQTMRKKRNAIRAEKRKQVLKALKQCPESCDWKAWVAKQAGVTKNWLTYNLPKKPKPGVV